MSGRSLSLSDYRVLVRSLPRPTREEMEQFAAFVARAHSWYKHLLPWPFGGQLAFFLDPSAGMQRLMTLDGSVDVADRGVQGFHHSWIPTQDYRRRFGFLAYAREGGTRVHLATRGVGQLVPSDDDAMVFDPDHQALLPLPPEVVQAGKAVINALIQHHNIHEQRLLETCAIFAETPHKDVLERVRALCATGCASVPPEVWPAESGGAPVLTSILQRICALQEQPSLRETLSVNEAVARGEPDLTWVDNPLYELLRPERRRQLAGMVTAMARVVDLTHGEQG